ncbi:M23 family metallopeptidase [Urechidicola vernalis]|uniref:Peptidoglycan DD-metalloendopeptidase family protein n=1 Tax=Urechidicola vernalis TaxID=3075600 RepID=A0ABU2Y6F3_9FLAO|nr:peptidoglycan DD-metalloendopeptidase family protein [Urechidicola sp. P050]MDT0553391.1 peptidoglycan DD-metalloendopeptidase family protein [Urechidicola sp. P050]
MKNYFALFIGVLLFVACGEDKPSDSLIAASIVEKIEPTVLFGYNFDDYHVVQDTLKDGESFGEILDRNHVEYPTIYKIATEIKDSLDVRHLRAGKPYTVLAKKDSTEQAQVFIYQHNKIEYTVVDFSDSIQANKVRKPIKIVEKTAAGIITSSLSETLDEQGLSSVITTELSTIYAWTIDFFRIMPNDKFKIVYEEKFIDDTISAGIGKIKAAYFEHGGKPFYAFKFTADSINMIEDYYDEETNVLRRQFLKAPIQFDYRISSRYNLKRRIAYYGNKVRAHKGTDFAARVGTPIIATANGIVTESRQKGGNGKYVKIKHNGTYSTQYLHMSRRAVNKGEVVKQGDIIGYVGMTGNTGGPHVCYRFWKNGRQVDPLKQKLPAAKPMKEDLKPIYLEAIKDVKSTLDGIVFTENSSEIAAR